MFKTDQSHPYYCRKPWILQCFCWSSHNYRNCAKKLREKNNLEFCLQIVLSYKNDNWSMKHHFQSRYSIDAVFVLPIRRNYFITLHASFSHKKESIYKRTSYPQQIGWRPSNFHSSIWSIQWTVINTSILTTLLMILMPFYYNLNFTAENISAIFLKQ